jgi:hypothetical protein
MLFYIPDDLQSIHLPRFDLDISLPFWTRHDLHIFLTHHESEASKVHAAAFHSQIKLELSGRAPHGHSGHGGHGEERQERQERQKLARRVKTMRSLMSMKSGSEVQK